MRPRISIWGSVRPSLRPSVRPFVTCFFRMRKSFFDHRDRRGLRRAKGSDRKWWKGQGRGWRGRGDKEGGEWGDNEGDASDGRVSGLVTKYLSISTVSVYIWSFLIALRYVISLLLALICLWAFSWFHLDLSQKSILFFSKLMLLLEHSAMRRRKTLDRLTDLLLTDKMTDKLTDYSWLIYRPTLDWLTVTWQIDWHLIYGLTESTDTGMIDRQVKEAELAGFTCRLAKR